MELKLQDYVSLMQKNPNEAIAALSNINNPLVQMGIGKAIAELGGMPTSPELLRNLAVQMGIPKEQMSAEFTNQLFQVLQTYQKK